MSSYPPPQPPVQYPPVYDRNALRAQRQILRAQAKAQHAQQRAMRYQLRAQRRSLRRGSIVGPLIILGIGVMFLLAEMGRISWGQSLEWYGRWWPAVLIGAGVVLLLEWFIDQQRATGPGNFRVLGGGVVFLLILLVLAGLASRPVEYGLAWQDHTFGNRFHNLDYLFGDRHDADSSMTSPLANVTALVISNPHGDVTVTGSSSDGQVHVNLHTQTYAWKQSDIDRKTKDLQPTFSNEGGILKLDINPVDGGEADLIVSVPHSAPITVQADHGDVNVSEMAAPVTISANHGDVDVSGIDSSVTLHMNDDDGSVTLHSIHGNASVQGHSGDIVISDVTGELTLQGDFFGSTNLEHINGPIHFTTTRTQFSATRLDDEFNVDNDSLNASELLGPVVLKTENKNITLDRIQGSADVSNRNGSVELTHAPPLQAISIQNQHGSVDLGLPGGVGFTLNAQTRNGDMENDFDLSPVDDNDVHTLRGRIGGGGPTVTIATTDGDVTVRRSTVAPLPPAPPAAPRITLKPPPPHKSVAAPHAPAAPAPPPPAPGTNED
jgi:DUF4097 and DUF4098 domain-containing protein YvlB